MNYRLQTLTCLFGLAITSVGCTSSADDDDSVVSDDDDGGLVPGEACDGDDESLLRPSGWKVASHCKGQEPNYGLLFDDTRVHRIDIELSAEDSEAALDDLENILTGGSGSGEPMWVPVTVRYDGDVWTQVGMRYKGNSSLRQGYQSGVRKLPFRLGFDKYEDEAPESDDQRFHGFKKMTFSSGFKDASLMRDKVGADIFRAAGVPAAFGSFVEVHVDSGGGPVYFGLYTMIEDPSNKMLDTQFGDDSGNLYKPDGPGAALVSFNESSMVKKTNEQEGDFSDVQDLLSVLHGDRDDASLWRSELESVFDVQGFLTLLAVNQSIVNWDSYGWMTHNYYMYADPSDDGRFVWFPWDLNESLLFRGGGPGGPGGGGPGGGGPGGGGLGGGSESVLLDEVTEEWPMIRYLLDDPTYLEAYLAELESVRLGAFETTSMEAKVRGYHALIADSVAAESAPYSNLTSLSAFEESVEGEGGLIEHIGDRHDAVEDALGL